MAMFWMIYLARCKRYHVGLSPSFSDRGESGDSSLINGDLSDLVVYPSLTIVKHGMIGEIPSGNLLPFAIEHVNLYIKYA